MTKQTNTAWLDHKEIGRRVAAIRESLGVSQAVMAGRLGRGGSQSRIGKLEGGRLWGNDQAPDTNLLLDIAALAGLDLGHFQTGSVNHERAEMLIAAKWMARAADELRARAKPPSSISEQDRADALDSLAEANSTDNLAGDTGDVEAG